MALTKKQRQMAQVVLFNSVHPDKITINNAGYITCRWTYFYRLGKTVQTYTRMIDTHFDGVEIIGAADHYSHNPHDSYFWVQFQVMDWDSFEAILKALQDGTGLSLAALHQEYLDSRA